MTKDITKFQRNENKASNLNATPGSFLPKSIGTLNAT